jgi:DNA invertase Pin-like site-specific DNA recombinase
MASKRKGFNYIRFSTPEQRQVAQNLVSTDMAERYAASHDIELDDSLDLRDLGISAYRGLNARSGKLGLFLRPVESGKVQRGSVLLVESFDRLSRMEPASSLNQVIQLLDKAISIVEVANHKEYTRENISELGNSMESFIRMALAHEESKKKSQRVAAAWQNKRPGRPIGWCGACSCR